jgi:hypothetical protein
MVNVELNTEQTIYTTSDISKVIAVVKASLESEEEAIKLLEKTSELNTRLRRYKSSDSVET